LVEVKKEFNKPLPPAKINKKMFIWMYNPNTKVCTICDQELEDL